MVEQQRRLSLPPGYKPPRKGPTRTQILVRRLIALAVLVAAVAAALGVYRLATHKAATPPPAPIVVRKPLRITFPEGFTRKDMAARITAVDAIARRKRHVKPKLRASAYLALTAKSTLPGARGFAGDHVARSLEGFLFPDTYDFSAAEPTAKLVQDQIATFRRQWGRLDLGYARKHRLNGYDILTIASLVEKEAVLPQDRPKVARLIYNRLHADMPLQIDATLRYGLNLPGTVALSPYLNTAAAQKNPYNTRKYTGLPPTPIANPGLASLQAAAKPAEGCWLYNLAYPDHKRTYFTCDYRDFVNHERQWGYIR